MNYPVSFPKTYFTKPDIGNCAGCRSRQLCLPFGLESKDLFLLERIVGRRQRVARFQSLYRVGQPFQSLYAVHYGHFKTGQMGIDGNERITGFQMTGDILGLDGINGTFHESNAVALEDAEVCEIPFLALEDLFCQVPELLHHFHRIMSLEISREQQMMLFLGNVRAEQRFAKFLLNLGARYAARGYSATEFQLRMSRSDIGNYLGLTIESISRLLARFTKMELLQVDHRTVAIINPERIRLLAAGSERCNPLR